MHSTVRMTRVGYEALKTYAVSQIMYYKVFCFHKCKVQVPISLMVKNSSLKWQCNYARVQGYLIQPKSMLYQKEKV